MISNKLLSEITGEDVKDIYKLGLNPNIDNNTLVYSVWRSGELKTVNVFELAHRVKEWAIKQEGQYIIQSEYESLLADGAPYSIVRVFFDGDQVWCNYSDEFIDEWHTEPEAIFKAGQWILDNK